MVGWLILFSLHKTLTVLFKKCDKMTGFRVLYLLYQLGDHIWVGRLLTELGDRGVRVGRLLTTFLFTRFLIIQIEQCRSHARLQLSDLHCPWPRCLAIHIYDLVADKHVIHTYIHTYRYIHTYHNEGGGGLCV